MNYSIHAMMYGYYACRAARIQVPRPLAVFITSSQIAQMVLGVLICLNALAINANGGNCMVGKRELAFGLLVYSSFLVLFTNFFVRTYLVSSCSDRHDIEKRLKVN